MAFAPLPRVNYFSLSNLAHLHRVIKGVPYRYGMCAKLSYLPLETAENFDRFIVHREFVIGNSVKAKIRNYNTLSILKLLSQLRGGVPKTHAKLFVASMFRFRGSFQDYLDLCIDYGFIKMSRIRKKTFYEITDKGLMLIQIFAIDKDN